MILSSTRSDAFIFDLPVDILYPEIEDEYNKIFIQQPSQLITSMSDLLHDCVKGINIFGLNAPITSQDVRNVVDANNVPHSNPQFQRGTTTANATIDKRLSIEMRYVCGGLNYFALMQSYLKFWDDKSTPDFFQPFRFTALYANKPIFKIEFRQPIWASISENRYNASTIDTSEKTFTMTWVYNSIVTKLPLDINNE